MIAQLKHPKQSARIGQRHLDITIETDQLHDHTTTEMAPCDGHVKITIAGHEGYEGTWPSCGVPQSALIKAFLESAGKASIQKGVLLRDTERGAVYRVRSLNARENRWLIFVPPNIQKRLDPMNGGDGRAYQYYHERKRAKSVLEVVSTKTKQRIVQDRNWLKRVNKRWRRLGARPLRRVTFLPIYFP